MAKASFSYEVDFDGSKVELVNTLDLSELEDELGEAELVELVGVLLLVELAMGVTLGVDSFPPHAASTNDKDSDVASVAIFPTVFIRFLS